MRDEQNAVAAAAAAMQAQLDTSTLDFRIGVVTTDLEELPNVEATWNLCDFPSASGNLECPRQNVFPESALSGNKIDDGSTRPRYCAFTSSTDTFRQCIASLDPQGGAGSGEEVALRQLGCLLGAKIANNEQCGRATRRGPFTSGIYLNPPDTYKLLPRSTSATKLREGAKLVVVFLTDTREQSDGPNLADQTLNLSSWESLLSNYDGAGNAAFVAGIVCPFGSACGDGNQTSRWRTFLGDMQGIEAELPLQSDDATTRAHLRDHQGRDRRRRRRSRRLQARGRRQQLHQRWLPRHPAQPRERLRLRWHHELDSVLRRVPSRGGRRRRPHHRELPLLDREQPGGRWQPRPVRGLQRTLPVRGGAVHLPERLRPLGRLVGRSDL
jgi:hypothetical protein